MRSRGGASSWRKSGGPASLSRSSSGLAIARYRIDSGGRLSGRRLLFITDFHIRGQWTYSLFDGYGLLRRWKAEEWLEKALTCLVEELSPDWLVFGGDLVVHSCLLERAMDMMAGLAPGVPKLAVYGNWDKRRRRWMPYRVWDTLYAKAGFELLVNSGAVSKGIRFYGLDDFKTGIPRYSAPSKEHEGLFNCVVSHNPDSVAACVSGENLAGVDLVLCGHTHGGQARIPFFGAFKTSSRHWKRFEWGLLSHCGGRAKMIVSAGVGATFARLRVNCPPEAALIEFS